MIVLAVGIMSATVADPVADVDIEGNLVFDQAYYRKRLRRWGARGQERLRLQTAARQIEDALRRDGYKLAVVRVRAKKDRVALWIDEGRLAKIAFIEAGSILTLRLKLLVSLPHDVYNERLLLRQLRELRRSHGIRGRHAVVRYQRKPDRTQLVDSIEGSSAPRFALHIHLRRPRFRDGAGFHSHYGSTDGLRLGVSYGWHALLFKRDRWQMRLDVAAKRFRATQDAPAQFGFSRAIVDVRWYSPFVLRRRLGAFVRLDGDYIVRERGDETVESYRWFHGSVTANIEVRWDDERFFALGVGGENRSLLRVDQPAHATEKLGTFAQLRGVAVAHAKYAFDPDNPRRDRRHVLVLEGRSCHNADGSNQRTVTWYHQVVHEMGWHDLWFGSRGELIFGEHQIMDEEPVNRHVRGVFGRDFSPLIGSLFLELRYSIVRDIFKVGPFLNTAYYRPTRFAAQQETTRYAASAGLGLFGLFFGFVQLDLYYSGGWRSDGARDHGLSARVKRAY